MPLDGMRAGELDDRVQLRRVTTSTDPVYSELVETPAVYATVWAEFRSLGGGEFFRADQRSAKATGTFRIRWRSDVVATDEVVDPDGSVWDVQRIDPLGRREGLMLFCEARA